MIGNGSKMIIVKEEIKKLFRGIGRGHGWDHIMRVEEMALRFLPEGGNPDMASLIAMLHDADDYKLFPAGPEGGTPNADRIMAMAGVPEDVRSMVRSEISRFGYSKRLLGLAPETPEGQAVSDADMCDIMGATGILRLMEYDISVGAAFFDEKDLPAGEITHEGYMSTQTESACRHMFDKVLRLPSCMLTERGRAEALLRHEADVMFLKALFRERGTMKWQALLDRHVRGAG